MPGWCFCISLLAILVSGFASFTLSVLKLGQEYPVQPCYLLAMLIFFLHVGKWVVLGL